ncbi:MAG: hypothetical protein IT557_16935 [Alphaproteobacteria bacterium]|nr:hypothetical protein [Alphaproteobacteria bacterium]
MVEKNSDIDRLYGALGADASGYRVFGRGGGAEAVGEFWPFLFTAVQALERDERPDGSWRDASAYGIATETVALTGQAAAWQAPAPSQPVAPGRSAALPEPGALPPAYRMAMLGAGLAGEPSGRATAATVPPAAPDADLLEALPPGLRAAWAETQTRRPADPGPADAPRGPEPPAGSILPQGIGPGVPLPVAPPPMAAPAVPESLAAPGSGAPLPEEAASMPATPRAAFGAGRPTVRPPRLADLPPGAIESPAPIQQGGSGYGIGIPPLGARPLPPEPEMRAGGVLKGLLLGLRPGEGAGSRGDGAPAPAGTRSP